MGQGAQALVSMLLNVCILWPYRDEVRFVLLLLGDDYSTFLSFQQQLGPGIAQGILVLASGGVTGTSFVQEFPCDAPAWMPATPDDARPSGVDVVSMLRFWHSSTAKNGAHKVGIHAFGEPNVGYPCSLDCNNLMTLHYMEAAGGLLRERKCLRSLHRLQRKDTARVDRQVTVPCRGLAVFARIRSRLRASRRTER